VELFVLAFLTLSSFIATNLDNLLILVLLLANTHYLKKYVLAGFLSAVILVILLSGFGLLLGQTFNAGLIGYLGAVPLLFGCFLLYQQWVRKPPVEKKTETPADQELLGNPRQVWITTTILLLSNSADSIAVLLPLMAETESKLLPTLIGLYLLAGAGCCIVALAIVNQPKLAGRIKRHGEQLVPWIMIGVGLYILTDTNTDTLISSLAMVN
jgi:cadmium resistance protein CadD (predicted permease)